jgi:aspartokinase
VHVSMALSEVSNNFDFRPSSAPVESSDTFETIGKLEMLLADLKHLGSVSVQRNVVILSLVGRKMRHMVFICLCNLI